MSTNEVGIEEARKHLGSIADAAHHHGQVTILTRHGRQIASIVPVSHQENAMTATAQDVVETLATQAKYFEAAFNTTASTRGPNDEETKISAVVAQQSVTMLAYAMLAADGTRAPPMQGVLRARGVLPALARVSNVSSFSQVGLTFRAESAQKPCRFSAEYLHVPLRGGQGRRVAATTRGVNFAVIRSITQVGFTG